MTSPVGLPVFLLGYHDTIRAWMTTEWVINASPSSTKASVPSLGSSASSAGTSTSSAKWWLQDPALWVQGPCQLGTRCFKAQTHSVRGQGTTGGTWWHQWQFHQQTSLPNKYSILKWAQHMPTKLEISWHQKVIARFIRRKMTLWVGSSQVTGFSS